MGRLACGVCVIFLTLAFAQSEIAGQTGQRKVGQYTVVAKINGKPFKSYTAEVKAGKLQQHPRSRMDMEPHTDFISPRQVDTSSRTTSRYSMRDIYWVRKS